MIKKLLRILNIKESHQRHNIYDTVFKFIDVNKINGCFGEFGTYQGRSANFAFQSLDYYNRLNLFSKYYFFDSFQGLPDLNLKDSKNNNNKFEKNQYSSTIEVFKNKNNFYLDKINYKIIKGYYQDSLMNLKIDNSFSFVHIDVDLHSSCIQVLDFLNGKLSDGVIFLFDDFFCYRGRRDSGVQCAFNEWLEKNKNMYYSTEYYKYSTNGCSFIINLI